MSTTPRTVKGSVSGLHPIERDYTMTSWYMRGFDWADQAAGSLATLLSGEVRGVWVWSEHPGTGKTGFAVCACKEWAETGREYCEASFTIRDAVILRMPEISGMDYRDRVDVLNKLKSGGYGLVVLDDFHRMRFGTETVADFVHALLDYLYTHGKSFIVTANASPDGVQAQAGAGLIAAMDRFNQGGMVVTHAKGGSFRR